MLQTKVTPNDIRVLCRLAGLAVPAEDLVPLAEALQRHLAAMEGLRALSFGAAKPAAIFDARWR